MRAACRSTAMSAASRRDLLPVPMMNIINGGAHADNPIDFQEFMIMPVGAESFAEAVRCGAEIFHTLKKALHDAGLATAVGDEGGFAPNLASARDALDFIMTLDRAGRLQARRRRRAGARLRGDRILQGRRLSDGRGGDDALARRDGRLTSPSCARDYPIRSIEDGMAEDDLDGWKALTDAIGGKVQLVGDDLFVTNPKRLRDGHRAAASPIRSWSRSTRSAR